MHNDLTVPLFFVGAALTVAVCAITIAGWKHKLLVWGLLSFAALLALLGVFWTYISTAVPGLGAALTSVATTQFIWFLAIIAALISTVSSNLKVKRLRNSNSTDLAVIEREVKDARRLDNLEAKAAAIEAELDAVKDGKDTLRAGVQSFMGAGMNLTTELHERLAGDIEKLGAELHAIRAKQSAIIDDYQRMLGLEGKMDDALSGIRSDLAITREQLEKAEELRLKDRDKVRSAFYALRAREHLERVINPVIRSDAEGLNRRHDEGRAFDGDAWNKWENVHHHWFNALCGWWHTARFYMNDCREVLMAPDSAYANERVDESLFPNAEATRVFRKFRIIQRQWEAAQEKLNDNLSLVAFGSLTELEVRDGRPPEQGDRPF